MGGGDWKELIHPGTFFLPAGLPAEGHGGSFLWCQRNEQKTFKRKSC
jgi:hypothetical protein